MKRLDASESNEDFLARLSRAARQEQFLHVVSRDEAASRFRAAVPHVALPSESVPLAATLGRALARDVASPIDVPPFDRALVDGFALRSSDTLGASEAEPARLGLNHEILACGVAPRLAVEPGTATTIATGGMIPRGADAVVMVEATEIASGEGALAIDLDRGAAPGQFVGYAGSDMGARRDRSPQGHRRHRARDRHAGRLRPRCGRDGAPAEGRRALHRRRVVATGPDPAGSRHLRFERRHRLRFGHREWRRTRALRHRRGR